MAGITIGGLATGMDTNALIDGMMGIERRPLERLEKDRDYFSEQLDGFKAFDSLLKDFRDSTQGLALEGDIRKSKVSVGSEEFFTASSTSALPASYQVQVGQLAQVQKNVSDSGFYTRDASAFDPGTLTLNVDGTDYNITIDASNNSLDGIAGEINKLTDASGNSLGISALIIDDGTVSGGANKPYHLVLSGKDASSSFTMTGSLTSASEPTFEFTNPPVQNAQQAIAVIDGIEVVSDSNTIDSAVTGVSFNLVKANASTGGPGAWVFSDPPTAVNVTADNDGLYDKLKGFVDSYNEVMSFVNGVDSDTEDDANPAMALLGDRGVAGAKRHMQSLLSTPISTSGSFRILADLGISTNKDGTLDFDSIKGKKAIDEDFDSVVKLLSGEDETDGVIKQFKSYLFEVTKTGDGFYDTRKDGVDLTIKDIDKQIVNLERRMDVKEETLRKKFTALETLVSGMNSQSAFLTQQMEMMSAFYGVK